MSEQDWALWGHLRARYETSKPRRMLTLDGGGIRGLLTLKVLLRLEKLLREHYGAGDDFRLSQFFDYVGGTSTGAIIAAGVARGMSVMDILEFYREFGKAAFTSRSIFQRWKSFYDNGPLQEKLQEVFSSSADLKPEHFQTLLLVVARNATTDSAWPISSNPAAKYNNPARPDCNLQIPLWQLVRASTAAPIYFPPEVLQWDPADPDKAFVFVDGGTTSYNNPAFCMARMATEPYYRLNWQRGEKNLLIVSAGTGNAPVIGTDADDPETNMVSNALSTISVLMNQAAFDQDVSCRTVGRCTHGHIIDREIGDLVPRPNANLQADPIPLSQDLGRQFLYARYNVELTRNGLRELGFTNIDPGEVGKLDSTDAMDDLERIGDKLAEQVDLNHFGTFLNEPLYTGTST